MLNEMQNYKCKMLNEMLNYKCGMLNSKKLFDFI